MTRCLRKDLHTAYNLDSSMVAAHQNVYDNFKVAEGKNTQGGLVYGEYQVVWLPEKCTGLVEQSFAGDAPSPFKAPCTVTETVNGVEVMGERKHMQFVLNMTFRARSDFQFAKEKKAVSVTVQLYDILGEFDSKDDVVDEEL